MLIGNSFSLADYACNNWQTESPMCHCGKSEETTEHFFLACGLYQDIRPKDIDSFNLPDPENCNTNSVGTDIIDVDMLKTMYPHPEPIALKKYSYADVEMILGQDVFHSIRPLEYFDSDRKQTPVAVRLPLGWVLSGPLPSTSGFYSTCFEAVTCDNEFDTALADQLRNWYNIESYGTYKQVDSRYAADARASKILDETTYHDGSRYQVGMLWAEDGSSLPNNYFCALVQLKSLERRFSKDPELKQRYGKTTQDDLDKGYIEKNDKTDCFKVDNPREWYLPHHPVVHPH